MMKSSGKQSGNVVPIKVSHKTKQPIIFEKLKSGFPLICLFCLVKQNLNKNIAIEKATLLEIHNTHEKLIFCSYETK